MTAGRPTTGEERESEAIAWLVRLNGGDASLDDWRAHEAWLAADPANPAAHERVEALWADLGNQAEALKRGLDGDGAKVIPLPPRRTSRRALPLPWAAAAALAILAAGGGGYAVLKQLPQSYRTAPGEIRPITLSDGTRIDLNGGSRIVVRYDRHARHVTMAEAEAAFDVTRDPGRPFLIRAGDERIRVIGTAFDVVNHGGGLTVTVRRGVVEVAHLGEGDRPTDVTRVPAGYRLVHSGLGGAARIAAVDPDEAFAWREHRLVFHGEPLGQVVAALNRAFPTPIEVQGPAAELRFTGVLVLDDEDAVVSRLQAFLPLKADRSGRAIVLSSRP